MSGTSARALGRQQRPRPLPAPNVVANGGAGLVITTTVRVKELEGAVLGIQWGLVLQTGGWHQLQRPL